MSRLDEELEALKAIYEDSIEELRNVISEKDGHRTILYKDETVSVKISLSPGYPEESGVKISSIKFYGADQKTLKSSEATVVSEIVSIINRNSGEEVLFDVIEYLRKLKYILEVDTDKTATVPLRPLVEFENDVENGKLNDDGSSDHSSYEKSHVSGINTEYAAASAFASIKVYHGELTMEKKSQFLSHFAYVTDMEAVNEFRSIVLSDKKCSRATHNIFAYRYTCPRTGINYNDCDDDGETAAGSRLAEILRIMGVSGVAVIVSRWYGGTKLGPDRFKFILNSARKLLEQEGVTMKPTRSK